MVVAILSGRADWQRRITYFATLCAIGFGFGGSMSYMKDIAYTHASDSVTVIYGFGCVFLLGFIWAAPAGTGIAMPAYLDREELTKLYVPLTAVFLSWYLQDVLRGHLRLIQSPAFEFVAGYGMSAIIAGTIAVLFFLFARKYWGFGTSLMLHMSIGWWVGYFILIRLLHIDLNPPRGDTWASCLGLVGGILVCCWQRKLPGIGFATLSAGFLGGIGFAMGTAVKILAMATGYTTNWHSIMEQTQGLFLGIALGLTMVMVMRRAPAVRESNDENLPVRRWTEVYNVTFVLWMLTYLNFRRSPGEWVDEISNLEPRLYGIPLVADLIPSRGFLGWLDIFYLAIGVAIVFILIYHLRHSLAFLSMNWLGKGQLFYLVFLWWIVTINFTLVLPRFTPMRLVTEGTMTINAVVCSILLIYGSRAKMATPTDHPYAPAIRKMVLYGMAGAVAVIFLGFGVKRAAWGNKTAGVVNTDHVRFGPNNTNTIR